MRNFSIKFRERNSKLGRPHSITLRPRNSGLRRRRGQSLCYTKQKLDSRTRRLGVSIPDTRNFATAFRTTARLAALFSLARVSTRRSLCRLFAWDCTAYLSVALKRNTCTLRTYETCGRDASQTKGRGKERWRMGTSRLIARQTDNTETGHGRHSITNHISSMNAYLARMIRL